MIIKRVRTCTVVYNLALVSLRVTVHSIKPLGSD
jgi:hypothetical protein